MVEKMNIEKLNSIKKSLMLEIYRQCIERGIDPDTFDYTLYINSQTNPVLQSTLEANCKKLDEINRIVGNI
jgi:hypothetical protein